MYNYTEFDDAFIKARNSQFRNQVERRINGNLTEDEFKPLRLMNGFISTITCIYAKGSNSIWHFR